ncbi:MAG TPA: DUF805 domain-containing protein [Acidimicrobiales bacterium]
MTFDKAVRTCFVKYVDFRGRASRSEYWYWVLFFYGGLLIILFFTKLYPLWEIGLFIPTLAVAVRRMHDSNHSGWWIICPVANFVLLFFPSTGPNRFGVQTEQFVTVGDAHLSTASSVCPTCGAARQLGQKFCQGCGTKFQ